MNIFLPENNAKACAEVLDDKRLIKQILECAQLLATAQSLNIINTKLLTTIPYKPTHVNHPLTKWVAATRQNYLWTVDYMVACGEEYTYRFGKQHKCIELYKEHAYAGAYFIPDATLQPFVNCTLFKDCGDVHTAYKAALLLKWHNDKRSPKWTKRSKPNYG